MRWTPGRTSSDVEDRRGWGGIGGAPVGIGGAVVLLVLSLVFGRDFLSLIDQGPVEQPATATAPISETPEEQQRVKFVSFVLDDAQAMWDRELQQQSGVPYRHAKLVLFRDAVKSECGVAQSTSGPFYCPLDGKVYIDLSFYDELQSRFGAPGDFAQAYVIAHEIGHHVQNELGIAPRVRQAMEADPSSAREYSVALELQADCLAGVWGHSTANRNILDPGDTKEGLAAAAAVGDDRLQRMSGRAVNPESFTHGSSEQRMAWFQKGFSSGRVADCDTFRQ